MDGSPWRPWQASATTERSLRTIVELPEDKGVDSSPRVSFSLGCAFFLDFLGVRSV